LYYDRIVRWCNRYRISFIIIITVNKNHQDIASKTADKRGVEGLGQKSLIMALIRAAIGRGAGWIGKDVIAA
jgi:hypothetical protein